MKFDRETQTAQFHSPLEDFKLVDVDVEVRTDPLTGRQARIAEGSFVMPEGEPDIAEFVEDDEGCFFCPETVEEVTPTYPDWFGEDRGSVGAATSFPNLNPYAANSNVVALTEEHYRPIDGFTEAIFADGLTAALEFVNGVLEHDGTATMASVNMNFLRAAGSSIVHPHIQTLVDDCGTNEQAARLEHARAYHDRVGSVYWDDLLEKERGGERSIGSTTDVTWHAPFAPKHHYHVQGILETDGLPTPGDAVIDGFADGLTNLLDAYADLGLNSFNWALHLARDEPTTKPVIDVIGRSVFDAYYWSDSPFFTVLHDEGVVGSAPEDYAKTARERF